MRSALRPYRPGTVMAHGGARTSRALRGCIALLALAATGCLDDSATAPQTAPARLAVSASVAGAGMAQITGLSVRVMYMRGTGSTGDATVLSAQQVPLSDVAPGSTISRPLTVELGPCLADPDHLPEPGICRVMIHVALVGGAQVLDVTSIGPVDLRPGQTAEPQAVTLRAVSALSVTPGAPATLYVDDGLQLTATATDVSGQPVSGRDIEWASSAQSVATVASNGMVTAVAPGTATITASTGGRQASVNITVLARPSIVASVSEVSFSARRTAMLPDPRSIQIANGGAGALTGLAVGAISYEGTASGWLATSLSGTTAPTTLSIRPSTTELAVGTYTAVVPVTAPGATGGVGIRVNYEVLPGVVLNVDRTSVTLTPEVTQQVSVTASGPVSQIDAIVQYGAFGYGWVDARMDGNTLLLDLTDASDNLLPGRHTAIVLVSAPEAPQPVEVEVVFQSNNSQFYMSLSHTCSEESGALTLHPNLIRWSDSTSYPGYGTTLKILEEGMRFSSGSVAHTVTGDSVLVFLDSESQEAYVPIVAILDAAPATMTDTIYVGEIDFYYCEWGYGYGARRVGPPGDDTRPVPSLLRSRGVAVSPTQAIGPSRASRVAGGND